MKQISDDPSTGINVRTVLILHSQFTNRSGGRSLARNIVSAVGSKECQCLLVDIRGHGHSDADDYTVYSILLLFDR